mgnify:CR=1 FL=1
MHVTALQLGELAQGGSRSLALSSRAGKSNQDLVGVQAGVLAAKIARLKGLDGFDGAGGDEVDLLIDTGQTLEGVEQGRGGR